MYTLRATARKVRSTLFLLSISLWFLGAFVPALATRDQLSATHLKAVPATQHDAVPKRASFVPNPKNLAISRGNVTMASALRPWTPSVYRTSGMDFSPYIDGQDPNFGTIISEQQLLTRMQIIANNTLGVRSFGCTHGLEKVGMVAHSLGLTAAVGAWLGRDLSVNDQEISNLIIAANAGQVDLAIIGSEVLLRNDLTESQLIGYINQVKQQIPAGIPVATADVYGKLLEHPAVVANCDVVLPNYYPYWEGVSVNIAIATLHRQHQQIVGAFPGKSVIVSETGWPSAGNTICNAVPSPANASFYFLNFVSWARANNVPYFYFDALDEAWKANHGEGPQGAHWGVWDKDGVLKPGMQAVFDGQTIPDNWTNAGIPGGPGTPSIEFTSVPPYGSSNNLFGQVLHVNTDDYKVAVYIYVGGWWTKPTFANPLTNIGLNGGWECDITTGGNDPNATQIAAFLVPATFNPPPMSGGQSLPPSLDQNAVARADVTRSSTALNIQGRVTDGNNQALSCVTISLTGSQTTATHTIGNGDYSFINLQPGGNYTVTPSHPSYAFSPPSWTFNNLSSNQTADFVASPSTSTITLSASPPVGGTVSGAGTFATGSSRTVTATANSGYTFANWTENGNVVSSSSSYTFTLNGNRNLVANFTTVNYTITVSASPSAGGTVSGGGTFPAGSSRTVTATANSGYTFANWTENASVVSSSASYTFTLNANRNLVANFTTVNYTITVSPSPGAGGTVSGGGTFPAGSSRTVTATANGGYTFVNWTENGSVVSSSASYTFTLNANRSLVANFTVIPVTRILTVASANPSSGVAITVSPNDNNGQGSGVTQFARTYNNNAAVTLTAPSTKAGNSFSRWQRDGVDFAFTLSTNVTIDANHTMTAVYISSHISTTGFYWPPGGAFFFKYSNTSGPSDYAFTFGPANQGWTPVVGDWNGDGITTIGLYYPGNGAFYIRNSNDSGVADIYITYGPAGQGWIPVIGDWDGNGTDTVGLYNPGNGFFYLRNSNTIGFADLTFPFGPVGQGWIPIAGDWDGDGVATIGLYNPANGAVQLRNSNTSGPADISFTFTGAGPTWKVIVGDWDGNLTSTLGLYNSATGVFLLRNSNTTGGADITFTWEGGNYVPLSGKWQ